jgi:hypothetical protein
MSRLMNHGENKLVDMMRGQGLTLPAAWHFALASAADDTSFTELAGTGYAREAVTRALANFSGTQGAGTTLASTGTSHESSNNAAIDFGTSGAAWGTANFLVACDHASAGDGWWYAPLETPLVIGNGQPVSIDAGALRFTLGLTGGMSDYLANKLIDLILRAEAYSWPANLYAAYATTTPSNSTPGSEPGVGAYARVAIASSLAAWLDTQGAGGSVASSGTGGRTENVALVSHPAVTADQGTATHGMLFDALTAGNLMFWRALAAAKTYTAGAAPRWEAGDIGVSFQ